LFWQFASANERSRLISKVPAGVGDGRREHLRRRLRAAPLRSCSVVNTGRTTPFSARSASGVAVWQAALPEPLANGSIVPRPASGPWKVSRSTLPLQVKKPGFEGLPPGSGAA
jgi:hypothetical protein